MAAKVLPFLDWPLTLPTDPLPTAYRLLVAPASRRGDLLPICFCNCVHYLCIADGAALFTTIFLQDFGEDFLPRIGRRGRIES
jgi:hypothetical protein